MTHERNTSAGFTLIEVVTVCAIIGVLAMLAYPNLVRFKEQQQTKAAATKMAGVLGEARSRATSEATPYLVYFNEKTVDGAGNCGPVATMVRDLDRSYSITAGDDVRDIATPDGACETAKKYGAAATEVLAELPLPIEDVSARALAVLGLTAEEDDGEGSSASDAKLAEVTVNSSTFPIDAASGRPVVAFSERGVPVDPSNPTSWGSGAGAIYMTDGRSTVYAAVVQPLGNVQLRVHDNVSGEWR
jgi:prepilin-type N-terminal cleavage/methylation domain-containing protein